MMSRETTEQLRAYLSLINMVLYNLELGVSLVKYYMRLFSWSL
jgi:hypothetical protein